VEESYKKLINFFGSEFSILLDVPIEEIIKIGELKIAEAIKRVREGRLYIEPGYDGEFGKVKIFTEKEKEEVFKEATQKELF
jgi:PHP family Zn ribbon phosphoesterase